MKKIWLTAFITLISISSVSFAQSADSEAEKERQEYQLVDQLVNRYS